MTSQQARAILLRYRPGETTSSDQPLTEALQLARQDPELAIWFGQHCASLAQLPPRVRPSTSLDSERKPLVEEPEVDRLIPMNRVTVFMVSLAMAIVIASVVWSGWSKPPPNTFESYRDRMARLVQRSYPIKLVTTDQEQIHDYFRTNFGVMNFDLPHAVSKLPTRGAAVLTWHNQPVSLLGMDAGDKTNLCVFLTERSSFIDPPTLAQTQFVRVGRLMTASWSQGDKIYLLTYPGDETALKKYLE